MGSSNPAPVMITTVNGLPIYTTIRMINEHLDLLDQKKREALSLLEWFKERESRLQHNLSGQSDLAVAVYEYVKTACIATGKPQRTRDIVFEMRVEGTPTGVRGNLSRLVHGGFLMRPKIGWYWPDDMILPEDFK